MNHISKKAVAYLLLLTYVFLLMPTFTVSAAEATKYDLPTVSLTWKDGKAPVPTTQESATYTAVLTLNGESVEDVVVTVSSFDISAKAGVDYEAVSVEKRLNSAQRTAEISVTVKKQTETAMMIDDTAYTKQFAVAIAAVMGAKPDPGNHTLLVSVGYTDTLLLVENTALTGNGSSEGYVHKNAGTVYMDRILLYTKTPGDNIKEQGESLKGKKVYGFLDNNVINALLETNGLKEVMDYYDENLIAFSGYFAISPNQTETGADAQNMLFELGAASSSAYFYPSTAGVSANYYWNFFDEDSDSKRQHSHTSVYDSAEKLTVKPRNDWTTALSENNVFVKPNGVAVKFHIGYISGNNMATYSDVHYGATLISTEKPKVLSYDLVLTPRQQGDMLCVSVKFSKPVQLLNGGENDLRLKVALGDKELSLRYLGGEYTDTLVFGVAMDKEMEATVLTVVGFSDRAGYDESKMIADLLWNEKNKNNTWDPLDRPDSKSYTISLDTRTPVITLDSCNTKDETAKSHTVNVNIKNIAEEGKVYYSWSQSSHAADVASWTEADYVVGTNAFTESTLDGDYYLHLKAVGVNGVATYWTYGALTFDNKPNIQYVSCSTEGRVAKEHRVVIGISNAASVFFAWTSEENTEDVQDWTAYGDFLNGQNTFVGAELSGSHYLHLKATSQNGYTVTWRSENKYAFDNEPPVASSVTCDTAENAFSSHVLNVVMQAQSLDDIKYAYMYVVDENGAKTVNGSAVYGAEDRANNLLSFDGATGTIKLTYRNIGMAANTVGKYKIGFVFEDIVGNRTAEKDILYSPYILFDSQGEFDVDITEDPETEIGEVNGYEVLVSGDGKSYEFKFKLENPYSAGDRLGIIGIVKNGKKIFVLDEDYSGTDLFADGFGKNDGKALGIESIAYNPENQSITITVNENAKGYYKFSFFYNEKTASNVSVYFTTENDKPKNFSSISEEGLLSNRVWTFANKRYYRFIVGNDEGTVSLSYEIISRRYAESGAAPAFSSKEKAYEYALFMELQDVALVYLGPNGQSVVDLLNSGASGHYKKATGETATAATGQTWIRYKNTVWNSSETPNAQDYAYYYYSNKEETSLDYNKVMRLLIGEALEKHAKAISNYDEGEWLYLTANADGVDGNGEPNYRKDAVFDQTLTYQGPFSDVITYEGDSEIYSTTVSNIHGYEEIDEAYLLANYAFTSDSGRTVLFYREYNGAGNVGEYTQVNVENGRSVKLKSFISKAGVYEFIEFDGNGSRKFFVYADYYAPTLRYEFTYGNVKNDGYIDRYVNGSTIRASTVTLVEFVTTSGSYMPEYDEHAYFYVTTTSGKVIAFMTAKALKEAGGYTLTQDTVIVYLYDRLGNMASVTIRANESDLFVSSVIKDEEALILTTNRMENEIAIDGFTVSKDNVILDIPYSQTLTFYESGTYIVEIKDIYGNTFTETYTFQRPLPVVEFQCKDENGDYVPMGNDVNGSAYVVSIGNNAYQVTASSEIRLKYDADAEYEFTIVSGDPTLRYTRSGAQYVRIVDNNSAWMIKISHKKDPSTYILVTCAHDVIPPTIQVTAHLQDYLMNELNGQNNVLFTSNNQKSIILNNAQTINCHRATISWADENEIRGVTFTKDGKQVPLTQTELLQKSFDVSGFGEYKITVTDILNNSSTFTFTIANEIGLDYYVDGKKAEYSEDPSSFIENGVYTDTRYTSKEVKLVLTKFGTVSFLFRNNTESGIYQIRYSAEGLVLYCLNNGTYKQIQKVNSAAGELFASDSHPFTMNYEIKDGKLILILPAPSEYEFWQFRVTDLEGNSPVIIQVERSDHSETVRFVEIETGELIETNENNEEIYVGAKSAVKVYVNSITDTIVKISVYYSEKETFDFYRKTESVLFGEGQSISEIKDEGYYKIVSLDIYGNEQIVYLRIGFGFEAVVKILYDTMETVEFSVDKSGNFGAKSNHSVQFTVWAERSACTVSATKNGEAFDPDIRSSKKYFTFTVSGEGEYTIVVDDGCGNTMNFTVSIKAPTEIVYGDYLTGFNEEAPWRDKLYTNGKVNVDYNKFIDDGIRYIFYRVTQNGETSAKRILYNTLIPNPVEYEKEDFLSCIGKEGNGAYEIVFADEYGNYVTKTVHISDGGHLTVSRLIENSAMPELLDMTKVLASGAWSNRLVILGDSAEAAVLTVDGKTVSFIDGEYTLTFPPAFAEGYEKHEIDYLDEYGNRYHFTVHLEKRTLEVTLLNGTELITVDGTDYTKSGFGYTWTDPKISAHYSVGSFADSYENGEKLTADGRYVVTFVDYAGNSLSKSVTVDTVVSYKIIIGHNRVPNGIATNEPLSLAGDGEALNVLSVKKDGEAIETRALSFTAHGVYEVALSDRIGNVTTVTFSIYTHAVAALDYTALQTLAIANVWMLEGADRLSYISNITVNENGVQTVLLTGAGQYEVELKDLTSGTIYSFRIEIDHTPPSVTLIGVEEGGSSRGNITLEGIMKGDHVDVYRNKELIYSKTASKDVTDPPMITEPGDYRLVVYDEAGNTVEYEFTREFTSNAASNIIILMLLSLVGASGFIFLIVNGKAKVK